MTAEHLLTDTQMAGFVRAGFVVLSPGELLPALHDQLFSEAAALYSEARRAGGATTHLQYLGDNLLARIPALEEVLNAPTVQGALTSILGARPLLHPHHFVHSAGSADQGFHQDGNLPWNTRGHFRSPRPIAAMLFYYPQAVTEEMGPTEVLPGTQYWSGNFESDEQWHADDSLDRTFNAEVSRADELPFRDARIAESLHVLPYMNPVRQRLVVPAGSVVIAHYDLVHRGTRQATTHPTQAEGDGRRFMYKFYYLRTQEPSSPSWNNLGEQLPPAAVRFVADELVVARVWRWLRGAAVPSADASIPVLVQQINSAQEPERRAAGYALADAGAVHALVQTAASHSAMVRRMSAFALGETRSVETSAIDALVICLSDADELVRSNAAFALGSLARVRVLPLHAVDVLMSRLDPAQEPDNTRSAGMSRSTVRECVAYALAMAACNAGLRDEQLAALAERGLSDSDRYVRGLVVAAMEMAAQRQLPDWARRTVRHLVRQQYHASPRAAVLDGRVAETQ